MKFNKDSATERAKEDLKRRIGVDDNSITATVTPTEFPNMSLGAPASGEVASQMLVSGWRIELAAAGKTYEYRADKYQLRLFGFDGSNYLIES